jgi:hypothetical protein
VNLKNPGELVARMELETADRLLLVDAPDELRRLFESARGGTRETVAADGAAIRAVKAAFDAVLVWRESRAGSRAVFNGALKRLEPGGALWIVTALKKVRGPVTAAVHRLELSDLTKAFSKEGLAHDREIRVSAWHVAYRFVAKDVRGAGEKRGLSPV